MKRPRSFRLRLLIGSILWTGGLLFVGHVTSILVMHRFPTVRINHNTLIGIAIALGFMAAGLLQMRTGLSPFNELRSRLSSMRDGRNRRVEGDYPTEVQPLVNDLNALLDLREHAVSRAVAKAGDLAHGLKTPLAVLAQEAERARRAGQAELAAAIDQQVDRMRRQVDYHLAHARAAASGAAPGARCAVAESAEGIARTLRRLYAERGLAISVDVPVDHSAQVHREDLDEMLGNLLDNACKWARTRVTIDSARDSRDGAAIVITVNDDGPGIEPSMYDLVLQRGVRADEAAPGSGFGLAIVRDLADLYKGSIALDSSPGGGLRARLTLPAC
ncbi:MAG: sensor histidine kinase [Acidobacteria bacterium]|nr:sensor histidine kinase [Acidobacteriota bacterium]